ncbi:MAG: metallophosphoesterase family protein [Pikeienuella sp.]
MTNTTTLAHLTDAHLTLHDRLRPRELIGKRAFSALNWRQRRRRMHLPENVGLITADIAAHAPDHIVMTGDAVNFGLPIEFTRAADWLHSLGAPDDVSFVPGNHEAIHKGVSAEMIGAFGAFSTGDDGVVGYPYLRRRGQVAVVGVSTCITTRLGRAQGEVGEPQLIRLAELLREARGLCRVILIHHPPAGPCKPRKDLRDRAAFADVIAAEGAELILHGHNHVAQDSQLQGPEGPVPVVGAPSASAGFGSHDDPAEWRLIHVSRGGNSFQIDVRRRRLTLDGSMEDAGVLSFVQPAPNASCEKVSPLP